MQPLLLKLSLILLMLLSPTLPKLYAQQTELYPHEYWQGYREQLTRASLGRHLVILHLGDSHLSGGFLTAPMADELLRIWGEERIRIERIGVPGATFGTFSATKYLECIQAINPDIVIISLGTNDSYTNTFNPEHMQEQMSQLIKQLRNLAPEARILLTTPPFAYLKQRILTDNKYTKRGRCKSSNSPKYKFNPNTRRASELIQRFAKAQGIDCYDLYTAIAQGNAQASAERWLKQGLISEDRVHYTTEGYTLLGQLIEGAISRRLAPTVQMTGFGIPRVATP